MMGEGYQRAFERLHQKRIANRAFYANLPTPPESRQVRRRIRLKANKAAIAQARRDAVAGRRKKARGS